MTHWLGRYAHNKSTYATDALPGKGIFKAAAVDYCKEQFLTEKIASKVKQAINTHKAMSSDKEASERYGDLMDGVRAVCLSRLPD